MMTLRKPGDTCAQCQHFFPILLQGEEEPKGGQCRRHCPTIGFVLVPKLSIASGQLEPKVERATSFPSVMADVWCGEFEPLAYAGEAKAPH